MKKRIYGYETEYGVLISSSDDDVKPPMRLHIYDYMEFLVSTTVKVLYSTYRKKGIFIENGGLFNYEALHTHFFEGLVEMATPECATPREVALYHTAQTSILYNIVQELNRNIKDIDPAFIGRIFLGKSNEDSGGKFMASHENYLVEDDPGYLSRLLLHLVVPLFWLVHLVLLAVTYLPLILFIPLVVALSVFSSLLSALCSPFKFLHGMARALRSFVFDFLLKEEFLINQFARIHGDFSRFIFSPWITAFTWALSPFIFRKIRRSLISFLVTRIIYTGTGKVEAQPPRKDRTADNGGIFEISQRARAIKSLCRIYFDDEKRPMIDMRDFFLEPLSALRREKRLHVLFSDTNMSSIGLYLKAGVTGLILDMIEDGVTFDEVQLKSPLEAMKTISRDLSIREKVPLRRGGSMTALEIQRIYLGKAREYVHSRIPDDHDARDIIEKWEYLLGCLEITPSLLYRKVDWVTKKDLIGEVIRDRATLSELKDVAPWYSYLSERGLLAGHQVPRALIRSVLKEKKYQEFLSYLTEKHMTYEDFWEKMTLYSEVVKVDLKFHEVDEEGYYYQLLQSNLVDSLFTHQEIEEAKVAPPRHTRAFVRGTLIKKFGYKLSPLEREIYMEKIVQGKCKIGWNKFYINWPWKKIKLDDPYNNNISSIEREINE
ncbi:MAG: proteasome accessory factor PafA2 family protein [Candidatus Eremiobacteraeota bacterium]|nr:proteasome accessory factor PafA2 family protein [Candidatus Eremiobacteraeota bacterium]